MYIGQRNYQNQVNLAAIEAQDNPSASVEELAASRNVSVADVQRQVLARESAEKRASQPAEYTTLSPEKIKSMQDKAQAIPTGYNPTSYSRSNITPNDVETSSTPVANSSMLARTVPTTTGGTITVTAAGKVTETNSQGAIIQQYKTSQDESQQFFNDIRTQERKAEAKAVAAQVGQELSRRQVYKVFALNPPDENTQALVVRQQEASGMTDFAAVVGNPNFYYEQEPTTKVDYTMIGSAIPEIANKPPPEPSFFTKTVNKGKELVAKGESNFISNIQDPLNPLGFQIRGAIEAYNLEPKIGEVIGITNFVEGLSKSNFKRSEEAYSSGDLAKGLTSSAVGFGLQTGNEFFIKHPISTYLGTKVFSVVNKANPLLGKTIIISPIAYGTSQQKGVLNKVSYVMGQGIAIGAGVFVAKKFPRFSIEEIRIPQETSKFEGLSKGDIAQGKEFHHTNYATNEGIVLSKTQHQVAHDLISGKLKVTPEFKDFYNVVKIKNIEPTATARIFGIITPKGRGIVVVGVTPKGKLIFGTPSLTEEYFRMGSNADIKIAGVFETKVIQKSLQEAQTTGKLTTDSLALKLPKNVEDYINIKGLEAKYNLQWVSYKSKNVANDFMYNVRNKVNSIIKSVKAPIQNIILKAKLDTSYAGRQLDILGKYQIYGMSKIAEPLRILGTNVGKNLASQKLQTKLDINYGSRQIDLIGKQISNIGETNINNFNDLLKPSVTSAKNILLKTKLDTRYVGRQIDILGKHQLYGMSKVFEPIRLEAKDFSESLANAKLQAKLDTRYNVHQAQILGKYQLYGMSKVVEPVKILGENVGKNLAKQKLQTSLDISYLGRRADMYEKTARYALGKVSPLKIKSTPLEKPFYYKGVYDVNRADNYIPNEQPILRDTQNQKTIIKREVLKRTERADEEATSIILGQAKKYKGTVSGSFARNVYLSSEYNIRGKKYILNKVPRDIDIHLEGNPERIEKVAKETLNKLLKAGKEARLKDEGGEIKNAIEIKQNNGVWEKAVEFLGEGALSIEENVPDKVLGINKVGRRIKVQGLTITGLPEEKRGVTQGISRLRLREGKLDIYPPEKREKDIGSKFISDLTLIDDRITKKSSLLKRVYNYENMFPKEKVYEQLEAKGSDDFVKVTIGSYKKNSIPKEYGVSVSSVLTEKSNPLSVSSSFRSNVGNSNVLSELSNYKMSSQSANNISSSVKPSASLSVSVSKSASPSSSNSLSASRSSSLSKSVSASPSLSISSSPSISKSVSASRSLSQSISRSVSASRSSSSSASRSSSSSSASRSISPISMSISSSDNYNRKSVKKMFGGSGFGVLVKRRGKFVRLPGVYTRKAALDLGAGITGRTLAATFKLERTSGNVRDTSSYSGDFDRIGKAFRTYQVRQGRRIQLEDTYIQRRGYRLSSQGERRSIQASRSSNNFFGITRMPSKRTGGMLV